MTLLYKGFTISVTPDPDAFCPIRVAPPTAGDWLSHPAHFITFDEARRWVDEAHYLRSLGCR